ncbi:MAG: hypothetical protein O7F71_17315 [Gammaproteobacteria bacterium]|nr:hypothetical protein [Gammaproteobacteria bacterium]
MTDDPLRPPEAELRTSGGKPLYSVNGILIATFCGSLAAGILLVYLNYVNLGYNKLAKLTLRWGVAGYMLIIALSTLVPAEPAYLGLIMILQLGLAGFAAQVLQGAAINYHREHRGTIHSPVRAAGLGFLTGIVLFFVSVFLVVVLLSVTGTPTT